MNYQDDTEYFEKRQDEGHAAIRRSDILAAQNARRYCAIRKAVARLDGLTRNSSLTMAELAVLVAVTDDLSRGNMTREGDADPLDFLKPERPLTLAPPISLEIVSSEPNPNFYAKEAA
jgi:hypothetical protein